jgi:2-acylglycerol O-acyltransferase 2
MSLGLISVSKKSCQHILQRGPGSACLIVVGGAAEALLAQPKTNDLIIKKRYGFIKLALTNGSSLVPIMSFGENDLFDQVPNPPGSRIRKFQTIFQRYMSFSPPLFHGITH